MTDRQWFWYTVRYYALLALCVISGYGIAHWRDRPTPDPIMGAATENPLSHMEFKIMRTIQLVALLAAVALFGVLLQGCSVNVIVAPHAALSVDSGNERNTGLTFEESPLYDCIAGPDADVCQ